MQFEHKVDNASYVVIPRHKTKDPTGRVVSVTPGIRVQFQGHLYDTEAAARMYGWDEDTRVMVEQYLMAHKDFNRPFSMGEGGLFVRGGLDDLSGIADDARDVCQAVHIDGDLSVQCGKPAVAGTGFCRDHLTAALSTEGIHIEPEEPASPVAAQEHVARTGVAPRGPGGRFQKAG